MQTQANMVQIGLFDRGSAVKELVAKALNLRESVKKKGKGKAAKVVKDALGNPVVTSRTITLLPRTSEEKTSLADITGLEGQALMQFEQQAREELMQSGFSHMAKLVASGNYTFKMARQSARGDFALAIKPAFGKTPILSEDELKRQAEVLGFSLTKKADAEPAPDGEAELLVEPKAKAKKKQTATPVATTPVTQ